MADVLDISLTALFYKLASEEKIQQYENALDDNDPKTACMIRDEFLFGAVSEEEYATTTPTEKTAHEQSPSPIRVGDMVYVIPTRRFVRVISISDDYQMAVVKEQFGAYAVPVAKLQSIK